MSETKSGYLVGNDSYELDVYDKNNVTVYLRYLEWAPSRPVSGFVNIEFMDGYGNYHPFKGGVIDLSYSEIQPSARISGEIIRKIKITTTQISNETKLNFAFLVNHVPDSSIDPRVYSGYQAVTTQGFVEANVKNGTEFNASSYFSSVPPGFNLDLIISTGYKPVLLKAQDLYVDGEGIQAAFYRNPTYTGGVNVGSVIFNANDINPQETTITMIGGTTISPSNFPTITDTGVQVTPIITIIGSTVPGSQSNPTGKIRGLDTALRPNTTYLYRRVTLGSENQKVGNFASWYEGPLSTEI